MTVFAASGDGGSGTVPNAGVGYPASDPLVTGCGGTTIEDVSGTSFSEVAWSGSGGGVSAEFPLPSWQSTAGVPPSANPGGHVGRGVPDVAGNGDPNSGYWLVQNGSPTGLWGGTSAVCPLYAGLVALLNAHLGEWVGYLNPNLYAFPGVCRDVSSGSNGAYNAGPGWDACTGLGSIIGEALQEAWPPAQRSIEVSIVRTDPGGDVPGSHLPVTMDFAITGTGFTRRGPVAGLPQPVSADNFGAFSYGVRIRPAGSPGHPGFHPRPGEFFSVTDVDAGVTVSAIISLIEG